MEKTLNGLLALGFRILSWFGCKSRSKPSTRVDQPYIMYVRVFISLPCSDSPLCDQTVIPKKFFFIQSLNHQLETINLFDSLSLAPSENWKNQSRVLLFSFFCTSSSSLVSFKKCQPIQKQQTASIACLLILYFQ